MKNLLLLILLIVAGCDSTKNEMVQGPMPTPSAKTTVIGQRVAGAELTISIEAPVDWMYRFVFVANFNSGEKEIRIPNPDGDNTVTWTYDEPGLYTVMGYAFSEQNVALSDAENLIIRPS